MKEDGQQAASEPATTDNTAVSAPAGKLFQAIEQGDLAEARRLLGAGADVNAADENGLRPLHLAKTRDMAALLADNDADLNAHERNSGYSPLRRALLEDRRDVARFLIQRGVDVNAKDNEGFTAMHAAAGMGALDLAVLLAARKADLTARNNEGELPLHYAATREMAAWLVERGSDVNSQGRQGCTPLLHATANERNDVVRYLLAKGAKSDAGLAEGKMTALFFAKSGELARLLINAGATVNAKANGGETPLHAAAEDGMDAVAEVLLARGAAVNARDKWGLTPLHLAARHGQKDMVMLLIRKGADIHAKDKEQRTPGMMADDGLLELFRELDPTLQ